MLATLTLFALASLPHDPPEWGAFRGNDGRGLADSKGIPDVLDVEVDALWRAEVPPGYSSPVVSGDDLFLTAAEGKELLTLCLERESGEVRWKRAIEFDGKRPGANSPASPSPATDGERVYVLFHGFGLVAYDKKGEELWRQPMGPFSIPHGMSTSPVLCDGLVLVVVDQNVGSYVAAFDAKTGEERWRTERPGTAHGYATPAVHRKEDGSAELVVNGSYQIAAYSVKDGKKLWWLDGTAWQTKCVPVIEGELAIVNAYMPSSSEIGLPRVSGSWEEALAEHDADHDGKIAKSEWKHDMLHQVWFIFDLDGDGLLGEKDYEYLASAGSSTGGLYAVRLGGTGDVTKSNLAWKYDDRRGLPDAPSPVVVDGLVYLLKDGVLTTLDLETGEVAKQGRVGSPDDYFASPIAAAGKLVLAGKSGQLTVVKTGREWEVLSSHSLDEELWATPAIAGEQVFVRTQEAVYCFQES